MTEESLNEKNLSLRKDLFFVLIVSIALSICFLGSRPFATRGEPREAIVAQAMLNSGSWLLGSGYGGAVPSKPPFMHWFIAAFSEVPGEVNELTARLPSALASILFSIAWFRFTRRHLSREVAVLGILILLTSVEWYRAATGCRVDMLLAALLGFSFIGLFNWWEDRLRGFPLLTSLALCGATLTKGPVGIALPVAVFFMFLLAQGERLPRAVAKSAMLVALPVIVAGLWYLAAYLQRGPEFFTRVYYENIARLTSTQEDTPHKASIPMFYALSMLGLFPWILVAIVAIPRLIRFLLSGPAAWRDWFRGRSPIARFSFIAVITFIIFFSIPSGKRTVYLLPVYPFISIGLASALISVRYNEMLATRALVRTFLGVISILGIFILSFATFLVMSGPAISFQGGMDRSVAIQNILVGLAAGGLQTETILVYLFVSLCLVGATCTHGILKRVEDLGIYFTLLIVIFSGSFNSYFSHQLTSEHFATQIRNQIPKDAHLYSWGYAFYGISFYLNREIDLIDKEPPLGALVFVTDEDSQKFSSILTKTARAVPIAQSPNAIDRIGKSVTLYQIRSQEGKI